MRLNKLHRVLVIGGAALAASCGDSAAQQKQTANTLVDAGSDALPSDDAAQKGDARGVDAWLSWAVEDPLADTGTADTMAADTAASADASDAAADTDAGVDAWLTWV